MKNRSICRRCHRIRVVDNTRCCPACDVELRAMERRRPPPVAVLSDKQPCDTVLELRKDNATLKQLADLEELVDVPPERGGVHFSDWERDFIKSVRRDAALSFSSKQREKIADVWHAVDLRKRGAPDEKTENLFSKLSPERQAEQRVRAAAVKLPWEK